MKYIPAAIFVAILTAVFWPRKAPAPKPQITFHFNEAGK